MPLGIKDNLKKYLVIDEETEEIKRFKCPVEGCEFTTKLGPGAIRMHIIISSDPEVESRYDKSHEEFYKNHKDELGLDNIRYLTQFPIQRLSSS